MERKADVTLRLIRSPRHRGIIVHVRTCQLFEDYFKELSNGNTNDINDYVGNVPTDTLWRPIGDAPLLIYGGEKKAYANLQSDFRYSLSYVGNVLNLQNVSSGQLDANISFLRIVGISGEEGVKFLMPKSVMSEPEMQRMRDLLLRSTKNFYLNFIKPVEVVGEIYPTASV